MGSRRKKLHSKQIHKKMKLAIIASLFIISGISAFTITEDEAKSAIVSSRVKRKIFSSDNESDCAEKQCNWEKYLEGRENIHDKQRCTLKRRIEIFKKKQQKLAQRFVRSILLKLLGTSEKCRFAQETIQFWT